MTLQDLVFLEAFWPETTLSRTQTALTPARIQTQLQPKTSELGQVLTKNDVLLVTRHGLEIFYKTIWYFQIYLQYINKNL